MRFPRRRRLGFLVRVAAGSALVRLGGTFVLAAASPAGAAADTAASPAPQGVHGLPFTRFYSFDEIGNVGPSARLSFDRFGRIAVGHAGSYVVLNDNTWINLANTGGNGPAMQRVVFDQNGDAFFGGFGTWGRAEPNAAGLLTPVPLRPAAVPPWIPDANFNQVLTTAGGVYFGGFSGVVYWDRATGRQTFFERSGVSQTFLIGDTVYASALNGGVMAVDIAAGKWRPVSARGLDGSYVDQATPFGPGRVLVSNLDGRLFVFDGHETEAWPAGPTERPAGRVTALRTLVDGTIALAVSGKGLFFYSAGGELRYSLTTADYYRITDLAAREPGVLWVATENGVFKVLYDSPLTVFTQRLGLPLSWPQIVAWRGRIVVATAGQLYDSMPGSASEPTRFELVAPQPGNDIWAVAAAGDRMLVGNSKGVFVRSSDGGFQQVLGGMEVARLVMVSPELCYVIGGTSMTAMRWSDGAWSECADRVPGLGYPSVVHASRTAAWIELGSNRAARVVLKSGHLDVRVFDSFPWSDGRWVNVGIVGDTAVLVGVPDGRVFFDEVTESFVRRPELESIFQNAPYAITRLKQDESGTIWASHAQGVLVFRPQDGHYRLEPAGMVRTSDGFPLVRVLAGDDVWLTAAQSLYHLDRRMVVESPPRLKPTLVQVLDGRANREIGRELQGENVPVLDYRQNSLVFRFFSGSYRGRQAPTYDFHLDRDGSGWRPLGDGPVLTLSDLREGSYRLDARLVSGREPLGSVASYRFEIAPPWFRTSYAYASYLLAGLGAFWILAHWLTLRGRAQNVALEKLVAERTEALRLAMERLNEETRNAATFAERDRLAGEIHDSLQQGLNGLMLQIDATLKLPGLPSEVRSRLGVARNMVSFTRHEVQHAVWDMETPLLEGNDLGDALKKLTALIGPGEAEVEIKVSGPLLALSPATNHHLLRIAQEAITNAVRHAAAAHIVIALDYQPEGVALSVTDDGNGFVPHDVLTKGFGHFGLRGLRARAAKIGGQLELRSAPGAGTTIRVTVKIPAAAVSHAD
ncbi:MAG TPA: ATP-binding protein [Lacunisphaera sp.]|jgi:signal transduction histidine kinase|nr:ATP-binding protein [Lacunisphaera sp.]